MPKKGPKKGKSKSKEDNDIIDIDIEEVEKIEDTEVEQEDYVEELDVEDEEADDINDNEELYDEEGNPCVIQKIIDDDNEYMDNYDETEIQQDTTVEYVKKEDRQSSAKLTKYEMVRILGERTKQLTMGAKILIKNHKNLSYDIIAEEELKLNMIPFKIRRPLPNGKFELWTLDELSKEHLISLLS